MMRDTIVLVAMVMVGLLSMSAAAHPDSAEEMCIQECHQLETWQPEWHEAEQATCSPYQSTLPRPLVFKTCRSGFLLTAAQSACKAGCVAWKKKCNGRVQDILGLPHIKPAPAAQCGNYKRKPPVPTMHTACIDGMGGAVMHGCAVAKEALKKAEQVIAAHAAAEAENTDEGEAVEEPVREPAKPSTAPEPVRPERVVESKPPSPPAPKPVPKPAPAPKPVVSKPVPAKEPAQEKKPIVEEAVIEDKPAPEVGATQQAKPAGAQEQAAQVPPVAPTPTAAAEPMPVEEDIAEI